MGFDDLPEFPQGGVARSESGNQGIPPEAFQQALLDSGIRLIADSKRPEETPAVQEALGTAVDTLLGQMGHAQPRVPQSQTPAQAPGMETPRPTSTAPASADTARNMSPEPPGLITPERLQRVMEKYSSPEELAKAYLHTDAARTRAQQERSRELESMRGSLQAVQQELQGLRNAAENLRRPSTPEPAAGMTQEEAEAFWKNPSMMKQWMSDVIKEHLMAYTDAQMQHAQGVNFEQYRQQKAPEIEKLRPFMDEVYMEDRNLYEGLDQKVALDQLLKRASERQEAYRARLFYEEMRSLTGQPTPGTPANTAPERGSLPSPGTGMSRVQGQGPAPSGNWSGTKNMDRLWKSRSDSVDEMGALTDVLKERGFGEDTPIY